MVRIHSSYAFTLLLLTLRYPRRTRLEMLDLSHNRLDNISGIASLSSLIALNLGKFRRLDCLFCSSFSTDNNKVASLEMDTPMPKLRILRASSNRLTKLNLASVPNLRTLYADNNSLVNLPRLDRLTRLENLSLRNQGGKGL